VNGCSNPSLQPTRKVLTHTLDNVICFAFAGGSRLPVVLQSEAATAGSPVSRWSPVFMVDSTSVLRRLRRVDQGMTIEHCC
jgi:hypothetical protein